MDDQHVKTAKERLVLLSKLVKGVLHTITGKYELLMELKWN
jgi:hypothetical protein